MNLKNTKIELKSAENKLNAMRISKDIEEYEEHWRGFLGHLNKIWVKLERECQPIRNKFEPWQGKYKKHRKDDELLRYLKEARDADEHTVEDIVQKEYGSMGIKPAHQNNIHHVERMIIDNGRLVHYEGDPIKIEFIPARVTACSFTSSGIKYDIPNKHMDKEINDPKNPLILAGLGLEFYKKLVNEAEKLF